MQYLIWFTSVYFIHFVLGFYYAYHCLELGASYTDNQLQWRSRGPGIFAWRQCWRSGHMWWGRGLYHSGTSPHFLPASPAGSRWKLECRLAQPLRALPHVDSRKQELAAEYRKKSCQFSREKLHTESQFIFLIRQQATIMYELTL